MSLILEALRRSEAQRRLGEAPGLHSPVPATPRRRRLPRWLLPALALMAVGSIAWWLGRLAVPDPGNGAETTAVIDRAPVVLPLDVDAGDAPAAARPPAQPEPPPVAAPDQRTAVPTPAPAEARVAPAPAQPVVAPPTPATRTLPAPGDSDPEPAAATSTPVDDPDLIRLADLPSALRASLPELRISMHVFAEDPTRRFAIIDGRRVGEGALLEGQGVVKSIRRDGVVVEFDGRRVLLPRP